MKKIYLTLLVIFVFVLTSETNVFGQLKTIGSPVVKNYTPENYLAAPENYTVVQDKMGIMYFGNYGFILEYDGVEWRKIQVKQYMPVLSMDIDSLGRIYVSAGDEFGYLASDSTGLLSYYSLSKQLQKAEVHVDGIGKVYVAKDSVYYQTAQNIYKYPYITEKNRYKTELFKKPRNWTTETRYLNSFLVQVQDDERFIIMEEDKGIISLEDGKFRVIDRSTRLMEQNNIVSILGPMYRRLLFVATEKNGIISYSEKSGARTHFRIDTKDKNYWDKLKILTASELPEYYVFSTLNKGTMVVNRYRDLKKREIRKLVEHYTKQSGMLSEQVTSIYNNQEHDKDMLWFTSKYGISKTKINSSLRRLSQSDETKDIILDLKRFDNALYFRTLGNIYYLKDTLDEYELRSVENIASSTDWAVFPVEEVIEEKVKKRVTTYKKRRFRRRKKTTKTILVSKPKYKIVEKMFAGSQFGLYEMSDNKGELVKFAHKTDTTYALNETEVTSAKYEINKIYRSKKNPQRLLLGLNDGLAVVSYQHGLWIDEGKVPGIEQNISSIAEDSLGNIWLGVKNNGLLYLEHADTTITENIPAMYKGQGDSISFELLPTSFLKVKEYSTHKVIPGMIENGIMEYNGQLLFSTVEGLYYFDKEKDSFEIFREFQFDYEQTRVLKLNEDKKGNVWILIQTAFSSEILLYHKKEDGSLIRDKNALTLLPDMTLRAIFPDEDGLVWISGTEGVFSFDIKKKVNELDDFNAIIRKVTTNGDSVLFWGNAYAGTNNFKNQFKKIFLEYKGNNIKFHFAAPFFDEEKAIEYSFYLEGVDSKWSPWTNETTKDYMNLKKGDYIFHVKARNIYGKESKEATFVFNVKTPWHEQWWAYAAELGLFLLLLFLSVLFNRMKNVKSSKLTAILTMITVTAIFKMLAGLVFGPLITSFAGDVVAVKIFMNIVVGALLFPTWAIFTRLIQTGSLRDPNATAAANSSTQDPDVQQFDGDMGGNGDL